MRRAHALARKAHFYTPGTPPKNTFFANNFFHSRPSGLGRLRLLLSIKWEIFWYKIFSGRPSQSRDIRGQKMTLFDPPIYETIRGTLTVYPMLSILVSSDWKMFNLKSWHKIGVCATRTDPVWPVKLKGFLKKPFFGWFSGYKSNASAQMSIFIAE